MKKLLLFCLLIVSICSCSNFANANNSLSTTEKNTTLDETIIFPELGKPQKLENGVLFYEVLLQRQSGVSKLWIYLPEKSAKSKIPCVFIAPAGSRLFHGTYLGEGSRPEHLPYVRAGFAVVAYEIDGIPPEKERLTYAELKNPAIAFRNAKAGLVNAKTAIDYAIEKVPQIDSTKLYTAGHSSAATLSLLVAENESRIKASIAYAPVTDLIKDLGKTVDTLEKMIPGYQDFLIQSSPSTHAENLKCPVFLFYAKDDSVVSNEQSIDFADKVRKTNASVTLISVETGNHYNSMIQEGIPQGIEWLKKLS